jgi:hypothetical protein
MEWILIGVGVFLLFKASGVAMPSFAGMTATGVPASGSLPGTSAGYSGGFLSPRRDTYPGAGTVTIGGRPADAGWNPHASLSGQIGTFGGLAVGGAGALGAGSAGGIAGSGFAAAGTLAGTAIPLIGIGLAVVVTILGMISAHHKAALAREGQVLNSTDPAAMQAFVLVAQATVAGEINSVAEAKQHTDQIVADWYGQVKSIQRGHWPYRGYQNIASFIGSKFATVFAQHPEQLPGDPFDDKNGPNPCNGACSVGHFFIERRAAVVLEVVAEILAGQHGVMVLSAIPAHETQSGFPEIRMVY